MASNIVGDPPFLSFSPCFSYPSAATGSNRWAPAGLPASPKSHPRFLRLRKDLLNFSQHSVRTRYFRILLFFSVKQRRSSRDDCPCKPCDVTGMINCWNIRRLKIWKVVPHSATFQTWNKSTSRVFGTFKSSSSPVERLKNSYSRPVASGIFYE